MIDMKNDCTVLSAFMHMHLGHVRMPARQGQRIQPPCRDNTRLLLLGTTLKDR